MKGGRNLGVSGAKRMKGKELGKDSRLSPVL